MRLGCVALVVLVVVGCAVCDDECLAASWAPSSAKLLASISGLETGTNFSRALSQIWGVFSKTSSDYAPALAYGIQTSGNFYQVVNCWALGYTNTLCTNATSQYIFVTRNNAKFSDTLLHAYNTDNNGVLGSSYGKSSSSYDPLNQQWWQTGSGWTQWTDTPTGETYYYSFSGGKVAADRVGSEPCSPCLTGSFPVPWALSWASSESGGYSISTTADVQTYAKQMIATVNSFTQEIFLEVFVGFDNGNFYDIGDCRNPLEKCTSTSGGYVFYVRNVIVYGNTSLVKYTLDSTGTFTSQASYGAAFPTSTRPWYTLKSGWTYPYTSLTIGTTIRTFAYPFDGGVAASAITLSTSNNCYLGRDGVYPTGYFVSPANSAVVSSIVVGAGLMAAFF